ncbi:FecR family protein [Arcticibacter sp.]|uniref:FecR family protein n=1 Tax=Arcticibacter sp. TaxID=1872630 RepID=UPI003890C541
MSLPEEKYIKELIARYKAGEATPAELQALLGLIGEEQFDQLLEQDMDIEIERYLASGNAKQMHKGRPWHRYFAAASIFLLLGTGVYLRLRSSSPGKKQEVKVNAVITDIEPGSSRATLTLADGSKIDLNDARNGTIAGQDGIKILKSKSGQLIYQIQEQPQSQSLNEELSYNTITTPRGGQWQVILPDGSAVWLNAGSSLRYPTSFSKDGRHVTLTGEAYFEVAKQIDKTTGRREPFLVLTNHQKIEVLGTHFNVNAYDDEKVVRTTLLEGKVRLSTPNSTASIDLKPGFEAVLSDQHFVTAEADAQLAVAWKNGDFIFDGQNLKATMRQIARWYDVDIVYQNMPDNVLIGGTVSRANKLSAVLRALELTGKVKVATEGRRVTLSK